MSAADDAARVFISWSGERSGRVAQLLRDWLPLLLDSPKLWLSSRDIPDGSRWGTELAQTLEKANVGILVLTPENVASSWLVFEAGALSKNVGRARVIPYCVAMRPDAITGPLCQFQAVTADHDGTLRLIKSLAGRQPQGTLLRAIERRLGAFWEEYRRELDELVKLRPESPSSETAPLTILQGQVEELAQLVRNLVEREPATPPPQQVSSTTATGDPAELQGAWVGDNGTHLYIRLIDGALTAVYCYMGNNDSTGEYYDWQRLGDYWYARFRWFDNPGIHGFAFYRLEDEISLKGMWWSGGVRDESPMSPPDDSGIPASFTRLWIQKLPSWAERYFRGAKKRS